MLLQSHPGTWVGTTNDTWNPIRKFYAKIQFKFVGRLKSPIYGGGEAGFPKGKGRRALLRDEEQCTDEDHT